MPSKTIWKNFKSLGFRDDPDNLDDKFKPEDVNNCFIQKNENYPTGNRQPTIIPDIVEEDQFKFRAVTEDEVHKAILRIKSDAIGYDEIPLKFVKLFLDLLVPYITLLYNKIISTNTFPTIYKLAIVKPIPKIKNPSNPNDLRPISILPSLSKGCEILLKDQIVQYVTFKKLITPFQSGFREHHSTSTIITKVCQDINASFDSNYVTVLILLDFTKAFDLIDHRIFIDKLKEQFQFSSDACDLMKSYLSDRSQLVQINGVRSQFRSTKRGVPQGSVFGPLAYTLSVNDLPSFITHCNKQSFADDTQIYLSCPVDQLPNKISLINSDLSAISRYCKDNGLVLNTSKTKAIIFSRQNTVLPHLPPIQIDNENVEIVDECLNLGIKMNKHLTWEDHVSLIKKKVYSTLRTLNCHRHTLSIDTKIKLVHTLLMPHFIYGNVIFSKMNVDTERHLQVCFNSCIRFIYNLRRFDHVSQFQRSIFDLSLSKFYQFQLLLFLFKLINFKEPQYLFESLVFSRSNRTNNIIIPVHHTNFMGNSFAVRGARLWNDLPHNLKSITLFSEFKRRCKEHLKNSI